MLSDPGQDGAGRPSALLRNQATGRLRLVGEDTGVGRENRRRGPGLPLAVRQERAGVGDASGVIVKGEGNLPLSC